MYSDKRVNVLGTEYELRYATIEDDPKLVNKDGYTDPTIKVCVVDACAGDDLDRNDRKEDMTKYRRRVARHELTHAFLCESGLEICSDWACNEEMIDWFAIQFPKIAAAFKEAECAD